MSTISASAARQTLPAQLDKVETGEQVAITRHGRVVAVLVSPAALRPPRTAQAWHEADRVGARLEQARHEPLRGPSLTRERAQALVDSVEDARSTE